MSSREGRRGQENSRNVKKLLPAQTACIRRQIGHHISEKVPTANAAAFAVVYHWSHRKQRRSPGQSGEVYPYPQRASSIPGALNGPGALKGGVKGDRVH